MIEHYKTLGIKPGASKEEIRQAFRRCAMLHHPDRNDSSPESQEKFKQCKAAYDALTNGARPRHEPFQRPRGEDLSDIFSSIFGSTFSFGSTPPNSGPRAAVRGRDALVEVEISLAASISGCELSVEVPSQEPCRTCGGIGFELRSRDATGTPSRCRECTSGTVYGTRTFNVSVPPGIKPGMRLRIPGAGHAAPSKSGPAGDLLIQVTIAPHPVFERHGQDLHCQLHVMATQAALGCEAPLKWIDGQSRTVIVPPGTQHGTVIRIPGSGAPACGGSSAGDLFCHVVLTMPKDLDAKQKAMLKAFNDSL